MKNKTLKIAFLIGMVFQCVLPILSQHNRNNKNITVHAVTDISHQFTFYGDHRFHQQYLPHQKGATNWCSLFNFDFSNANLLILLGCEDQISYVPQDIAVIEKFLKNGGGVVLLGDGQGISQGKLAKYFGVEFGSKAKKPFSVVSKEYSLTEIQGGGSTLNFDNLKKWNPIIKDADGKIMLASTKIGKGTLLVGARGLAGSNPNASDSINVKMWKPLLVALSKGKKINPAKEFEGSGIEKLEYTEKRPSYTLRYNDYLKPFAEKMVNVTERCLPVIEKRMCVPLAKGMGSTIALLATGGGGFSSGNVIALAVWWGDFPKKEDSMIEFITHESVHSWVLPYAEVWNEPIATYVGNLVMIDMGYKEEAERRIKHTIDAAKRWDPEMTKYDIEGKALDGSKIDNSKLRDIHWGKTYWVFEQLRAQYPDVIGRYFLTKRALTSNIKISKYDINNTVAVLSIALQKDLFPWFKEHGFNVTASNADIKVVL